MMDRQSVNVLVIGGAGYIGSHVVLDLCDAGYFVVVFDNFSTGFKNNVDKRAVIEEGDILNEGDLKQVFQKYNIQYVMHFCALKSPEDSMKNPEKYSRNNIIGTLNIIHQMLANKIYNIIFSSSCAVYGKSIYTPIDEDHPLDPVNYYGFTKLENERILKWYSELTNLKFVSLRYFNAAGYDRDYRIRIPEKNPTNLLPVIMEILIGLRKNLDIFGNDYLTKDGTCIRDFIHVNDLASAHLKSISYLEKGGESDIFNLASGIGYSVLEIVKAVEKSTNMKIPLVFKSRRYGDPDVVISKTKHKNNPLNWTTEFSDINTIIDTMFQVYSKLN